MVSKLPCDRLNHFSELDCSLLFFRVVFSFRIAEIFFRTYYASYLSLVVQFSKTVSPSLSCDDFSSIPQRQTACQEVFYKNLYFLKPLKNRRCSFDSFVIVSSFSPVVKRIFKYFPTFLRKHRGALAPRCRVLPQTLLPAHSCGHFLRIFQRKGRSAKRFHLYLPPPRSAHNLRSKLFWFQTNLL